MPISPNSAGSSPDSDPGRPDAQAITIADLTGTGIQAIAALALTRAAAAGAGQRFTV